MGLNRSLQSIYNWPRYREVANVLIKHGFGFLFDRFTLRRLLGRGAAVPPPDQLMNLPQRLRHVLEELGPTYVKLGQLLSTRPDILGVEYIRELEKLQDEVAPFSHQELMKCLDQEGLDLERDFSFFNPQALAAASIAQVHEATLKNGEQIVLKVQRPGIERVVDIDLRIIMELSRLLEKRTTWGRLYRIRDVAAELGEALRGELDFRQEGRNADIFYRNFQDNTHVIIPRVKWEFSSSRILALECIHGEKLQEIIKQRREGFNRERISRRLVDALFHQVFEQGFFHADPHPGNIAIAPGEKIIFYDFGQVGRMDEHIKSQSMNLIISMMRSDTEGVTRALMQIAIGSQHVNREEFRRDVARLQQKYYGLPLAQINLGEALRELVDLSIKHQMRLPVELSLLIKMLLTVESLISQLDPELSIMDIAEPYGRRIILQRLAPARLRQSMENVLWDYLDVARHLPRDVGNLVKTIEEGELKVRMEHVNLNSMINKADVMSNRLSLAIIVASFIIGTSLIAGRDGNAFLGHIPVVQVGFASGIVLGLFLTYSILKSGRY
ncbi:MAG TPA: AarF/ABC1/UbiB kinase family protein [Syntrophomonadaceae bacterium]|nr:AarF/ABC1/UbiB kinase family protein [Syntrophomonadaceae bacterium]